jgi:hypothetical protein
LRLMTTTLSSPVGITSDRTKAPRPGVGTNYRVGRRGGRRACKCGGSRRRSPRRCTPCRMPACVSRQACAGHIRRMPAVHGPRGRGTARGCEGLVDGHH